MMGEPIEFMDFAEVKEQGFRNQAEREFLTALFANAPDWAQLGITNDYCMIHYWDSTLMVAFDICDWNGRCVVRSLKVDFNSTEVLMGEASTNLFDFKFEVGSEYVKEHHKGTSPKDLAEAAAIWLYKEMSRPIVMIEWINCFYHHKQYEIADTNQPLSWADSQNKKRWRLGKPTRAAIVHPANCRKTLLI